MTNGIVVSFGKVEGRRAVHVLQALADLIWLAKRDLRTCDVGFRNESRALLAVARFGTPPARELVARVAFWSARAGGFALALAEMTAGTRASIEVALDGSDVRKSIAPATVADAVADLAIALGARPVTRFAPQRPVLRLCAGGRGWEVVTYAPGQRQLFVPSPLAPPVGDEFDLVVSSPGRDGLVAMGHVRTVTVRDPFEASEGAPAGFSLRVEHGPELHAALRRFCRPAASLGARSAPRYPVAGVVRVSGTAGACPPEHYLENLSHGGAFVRSAGASVAGRELELEFKGPHGDPIVLPATVAHQEDRGMGVQFRPSPQAQARLAATLTEMTAARPRVLIIDDDALARRMLSDAFAEHGYDVFAEEDALAGLSRLAEEVLALDLLVTDLRMPGLDGEQLVRRIREVGGERDLPILAVSASLDEALRKRLLACGADDVVSKNVGLERIADAAHALLRRRSADSGLGGSAEDSPHGAVAQVDVE